ncbi:hypothetical protein ABT186_09000 [Streptomyces sp. NPDC001634]|uniref:hypothetical protein n=1 Tax=Streptomyces sp. NPDC001634 TaxID=3154390 RepID=UPI00332792C7
MKGYTGSLNPAITAQIDGHSGATLAGSIYAVAESDQMAAARHLAKERLWIHADVIVDDLTHRGVDLSLVRTLKDRRLGPLDVHLIAEELDGPLDEVCAAKVDRVTFPVESCADPTAVAEQIHRSGAEAWLAVAPQTSLTAVQHVLEAVDGVLVMLIKPGSSDTADPALLARVEQLAPVLPAGVDGGVDQTNLAACLRAGARYVVSGRALFSTTAPAVLPSEGV